MGQAVFKRIQFVCCYFRYKASHAGAGWKHSPPLLPQGLFCLVWFLWPCDLPEHLMTPAWPWNLEVPVLGVARHFAKVLDNGNTHSHLKFSPEKGKHKHQDKLPWL